MGLIREDATELKSLSQRASSATNNACMLHLSHGCAEKRFRCILMPPLGSLFPSVLQLVLTQSTKECYLLSRFRCLLLQVQPGDRWFMVSLKVFGPDPSVELFESNQSTVCATKRAYAQNPPKLLNAKI